MRDRSSHAKGYLRLPHAAWLLVSLFSSLSCGGDVDGDTVKEKTMENLYYAYEEDMSLSEHTDTSLTGILEVYSLNPEIFGDPVRIISEFEDSLTLTPKSRQTALIVLDPAAELPAGIKMEEITGGAVLALSCPGSTGGVDSCWSMIGAYANDRGYACLIPGIEVFKDFGAESYPDSSIVELIVRIR